MKSDVTWEAHFYDSAVLASRKSKDSTKVGAVLVSPDGATLLSAYNGPPKGVADRPERFERPAKYLFASHAEANLIAFAAREGIRTKNCTVYVTHMCCAGCARTLIQAGISEVRYGPGTTSMPQDEFDAAKAMLNEARVTLRPVCL